MDANRNTEELAPRPRALNFGESGFVLARAHAALPLLGAQLLDELEGTQPADRAQRLTELALLQAFLEGQRAGATEIAAWLIEHGFDVGFDMSEPDVWNEGRREEHP